MVLSAFRECMQRCEERSLPASFTHVTGSTLRRGRAREGREPDWNEGAEPRHAQEPVLHVVPGIVCGSCVVGPG